MEIPDCEPESIFITIVPGNTTILTRRAEPAEGGELVVLGEHMSDISFWFGIKFSKVLE